MTPDEKAAKYAFLEDLSIPLVEKALVWLSDEQICLVGTALSKAYNQGFEAGHKSQQATPGAKYD